MFTQELLINVLGWVGVLCLLGAYGLLTFKFISQGMIYQVLNLVGAIGLGLTAWATNNHQSLVVQLFWGLIGVIALIKLYTAKSLPIKE